MAHYASSTRTTFWKKPVVQRTAFVATILLALLIPLTITMRSEIGTPTGAIDGAINQLFPSPNQLELRQVRVGLQLTNRYEFTELAIDNRVIPNDQIVKVKGLNEATFTAGEGKEIDEFTAGRHCATASYKPLGGTAAEAKSHTWCFVLH